MGEKFAHVGKKFAHLINLSLFSYEVREKALYWLRGKEVCSRGKKVCPHNQPKLVLL